MPGPAHDREIRAAFPIDMGRYAAVAWKNLSQSVYRRTDAEEATLDAAISVLAAKAADMESPT